MSLFDRFYPSARAHILVLVIIFFTLMIGLSLGCTSTAPSNSTAGTMPPTDVQQNEDGTYVMAEEMPRLIGGLAGLQKRVKFPEELRENGVRGRVFVQFIVDEKGKTQDVKILRSLHYAADEAALRAVQGAVFEPGKVDGKPVPVKMSLPITFK